MSTVVLLRYEMTMRKDCFSVSGEPVLVSVDIFEKLTQYLILYLIYIHQSTVY